MLAGGSDRLGRDARGLAVGTGLAVRPFQALEEMAHFDWNNEVLFRGAQITASELPRSYFLHLMAITTPEIVASLALGGVALCCWQRGFLNRKRNYC